MILHCSATPDLPYGVDNFDRFGLKDIDLWHRQKGWNGCGYHFVVRRSGIIETGRDPKIIGAHTLGYNTNSLGICYVGTKNPTKVQLQELLNLYVFIYKTYRIDWQSYYGHYEKNRFKSCPGFSMEIFRKLLAQHHELLLK